MRFVRYRSTSGNAVSGVLRHDGLVFPLLTASVSQLIAAGDDALRDAAATALRGAEPLAYGDLDLLSPIDTPPTFRDFYAFEKHVLAGRASRGLEMDPLWYEVPVFYFSNPYAFQGPGPVRMTPGSEKFDFELEVAAVLGGGGSDLTAREGENLVVGYCVLNDWSGRDVQQQEMRLSMGPVKGKDTATSVGPVFVTKDELDDRRTATGFDLAMTCRVGGETYSEARWSDVHWSFGEMVAYASRGSEVRANDVIGSGTANGGCILELIQRPDGHRYRWLREGDVVEAEVDMLGTLTNTVVAASPVVPLRQP